MNSVIKILRKKMATDNSPVCWIVRVNKFSQLQPPCNHSPRPVPAKCTDNRFTRRHLPRKYIIRDYCVRRIRCGIARHLDGCSRVNAWKTEIHNECRGPVTMDTVATARRLTFKRTKLFSFKVFFYSLFSFFFHPSFSKSYEMKKKLKFSFYENERTL